MTPEELELLEMLRGDYSNITRSKPCPACGMPMEPDGIVCDKCFEEEE